MRSQCPRVRCGVPCPKATAPENRGLPSLPEPGAKAGASARAHAHPGISRRFGTRRLRTSFGWCLSRALRPPGRGITVAVLRRPPWSFGLSDGLAQAADGNVPPVRGLQGNLSGGRPIPPGLSRAFRTSLPPASRPGDLPSTGVAACRFASQVCRRVLAIAPAPTVSLRRRG